MSLLKELVPPLSRVAVMFDTGNPAGLSEFAQVQQAAPQLGIHVQPVAVASRDDLEGALNAAIVDGPEALMTAATGTVIQDGQREIIDFANLHRLPTIFGSGWAEAGALMSYGPDQLMLHRRVAYYVDRILRGTRPADLPVELPTTFDLELNQTTMRRLGISIPPDIAAQVTDWVQ